MAGRSDSGLTVSDQVQHTVREYGEDVDTTALTLTMTLYRAMAEFDRAHNAELAPHRLSLGQFNVLLVLHRAARPLTMREVAAAVSVRPANLTGIIDALVRRSLVHRDLNHDDRRSFLVRIAPEAEGFLGEFLPGHWRFLQSLTAGLSARQQQQLTSLLQRLMESVRSADTAGSSPANG